MRGPTFNLEYTLVDRGLGPVFIANGEPFDAHDFRGTSAIDQVLLGWPEPLWFPQSQPLCGGPESRLTQRDEGPDFPETPSTELYVPTLSRLGPCQPGSDSVVIDNAANLAVASFGGGFQAGIADLSQAGSGEFRATLDNGAYVFAALAEPLVLEPGTYALAEAFAWYREEFYCSGTGTITIGETPGDFVIDVQNLGSAGSCPGTPINGELTVYWLWGTQQYK